MNAPTPARLLALVALASAVFGGCQCGNPPPSTSNSTLTVTPAVLTADGQSAATITVTVKDDSGKPIPEEPVTLSASGTGNALGTASGATDTNGTFTSTLTSTVAEVKTLTADVGGASLTGTVTFTAGAADPGHSTLTAEPNELVADGVAMSVLTVLLKDAQGNAVPNAQVLLDVSGTGNTLSAQTVTTDATGTAYAQLSSTIAEPKTVTATSGAASLTTTVTFTAGAPSSTTSTFTADPASLVADGAATTALTVVLKDAKGNALPGLEVTLSATGTANTFSNASGTTDAAGTFTATLASTKAEAKTITATSGALSLTADVAFVPGPVSAATSTWTAQPTSLTADGAAQSGLALQLRDAHGNAIPNEPVMVTTTGSGNTLSCPTNATDAAGTFACSIASVVAEQKVVTASAGGQSLDAQVTFVPGPPSQATSSFTAAPASAPANGATPVTLSLSLHDAQGNAIPNLPVTLAATGSANTFSTTSGMTDANGDFVALLTSTKAEVKTLTADAGGMLSLSAQATFLPGPPDAAMTIFEANPAQLTADGVAQALISLDVHDAFGNHVPGEAVALSVSGAGNVLAPASGTTNLAGEFTATLTSTVAELKTLTASVGGITPMTQVTFVPGPPSGATTSVTANPAVVKADGIATTTLTVTVRDAQNNLVPGATVAITSSGTNNIFSPNPPNGVTNASGVYSATLASTTKEQKTVSALVAGAFSVSTTVRFGCDVLVLGDNNDTESQNLVNALNAAGMVATMVPNGTATYAGTPAANTFSAIIVTNGNNYGVDMPAAGQTAIMNANAAGKGVVLTEWFAYEVQNARYTTMAPLLLLQRSSGVSAQSSWTVRAAYAAHPLWAGLPSTFTTVNTLGMNTGSTLVNGGVAAADCASCGGPGLVFKDAPGRIVQIAHGANYQISTNTFWPSEPNLTRMMVNSALWAGRCQ